MRFFQKFLLKIFGEKLWMNKDLDENALRKWLLDGYGSGFRTYYVLRVRTIEAQCGLGLKRDEYMQMVGRIKELKWLTHQIDREKKRRENEFKKKKKRK